MLGATRNTRAPTTRAKCSRPFTAPQTCVRTRGIPSDPLDSLISRRTSALQGSDHTPARLRHSATPRPQLPLCNANCLQSPCPLLLGSLHHRQSLQSSCVHITHTHRHNTPAHPLSKHTKPTRAPQMHSSDPHRCPTHVTHYTHKISSGTYAPTNTQICAQTQHTLH